MVSIESVRARLEKAGQSHLLATLQRLDAAGQEGLRRQIDEIDFEALPELIAQFVLGKPKFSTPASLEPAPYFAIADTSWNREKFRSEGQRLLREGRIAAFVVAGGQGSRLGFEGPKGCFAAGVISGKSLFQLFAEQLRGASRRYGKAIPWYIMTSPLNHDATVSYFESHHYFGLNRDDVNLFPQGVMPSFDITTGKILMSSDAEIATNPDGHGGSIRALKVSGALDDMRRRGIEHVSYFQVDNPHVRILDPIFIGLHSAGAGSSGEMSSKMIPKASPEEKVGVFCKVNGKVEVIEYSDLPAELQRERTSAGGLRFVAGSIAIHMISTEFIARLAEDPRFALPYHRAEKKIPCIDVESGKSIVPTSNNGVKLERFVFDALAMCRGSIVLETDRVEEFAPIKNATGADSVHSCHGLQTERGARWLESRGVTVPRRADGTPDCTIEISPLTACEAAELPSNVLPPIIRPGDRVSL